MDAALFNKALSQLPGVVAEMVNYELGQNKQFFRETVSCFHPDGRMFKQLLFLIGAGDLENHIKQAKAAGLAIDVSDTSVTVRRDLANGDRYIAEYVPVTE